VVYFTPAVVLQVPHAEPVPFVVGQCVWATSAGGGKVKGIVVCIYGFSKVTKSQAIIGVVTLPLPADPEAVLYPTFITLTQNTVQRSILRSCREVVHDPRSQVVLRLQDQVAAHALEWVLERHAGSAVLQDS
jgi:hypothetical protein